jgi:hypothetical protein
MTPAESALAERELARLFQTDDCALCGRTPKQWTSVGLPAPGRSCRTSVGLPDFSVGHLRLDAAAALIVLA